jgi:hypothetical protein
MATAPTSAGKYATAQRRTLLCKSSNGREDARPASAFGMTPAVDTEPLDERRAAVTLVVCAVSPPR